MNLKLIYQKQINKLKTIFQIKADTSDIRSGYKYKVTISYKET